MYSRWIESSDNLKNVAASVESLKGREAELVFEIDRLETARGVEEEIRKKYSVVKPGEEMVVVVDAPEPLVDNTEDEPGFLKRSWRKMKSWFSDEEDEADVKTE